MTLLSLRATTVASLLGISSLALLAACSGSGSSDITDADPAGPDGGGGQEDGGRPSDEDGGAGDDGDDGGASADSGALDASDGGGASDASPGTRTLRVMSFNIKTGSESSLAQVAKAITAETPDLVGLQEVDELTNRSGKVKQAEELAKLTGMPNFYFGASFDFDGGKYGVAILSKFPLSKSRVVRMDDHTTRGNGIEPRIAAVAEVEALGKRINFASMHASLVQSERALNAERVVSALMANQLPSIVVGDMNENPGGRIAGVFTKAGLVDAHAEKDASPISGLTIPSSIPLRRIDFVYKAAAFGKTRDSWVPNTTVSDHRPVMTTFDVPN